MTIKRIEIFWTAGALALGLIYTWLSEVFSDAEFIYNITNGILITFLTEIFGILIALVSAIHGVQDSNRALEERGRQLTSGLDKIGETVRQLGKEIDRARKFLLSIQDSKEKLMRNSTYLLQSNPLLLEVGVKAVKSYLNGFEISESGMTVKGDYWSLRAYTEFWNKLVQEQKEIGLDEERKIIARITHSNDIRIWIPEEVPQVGGLLTLQRQFVQLGGVIVRILIGPTSEPDDNYRKVMTSMKEAGIDIRYVWRQKCGDFGYDFLYLHDQILLVKWFAGAGGLILEGCQITDQVDGYILDRWEFLADLTEEKYGPMDKIPAHRQIGVRWHREEDGKQAIVPS